MCPFLQTGQLSSACDWFCCIHWIFSAFSCLFVTTAVQVTYIESGFHSQLTVRHGFSLVRYLTRCSLGFHSGWWPERASWWTCTLCYCALWPSTAWRVRHSSKIPSGLQVLEETFWVCVTPFHLCAYFFPLLSFPHHMQIWAEGPSLARKGQTTLDFWQDTRKTKWQRRCLHCFLSKIQLSLSFFFLQTWAN